MKIVATGLQFPEGPIAMEDGSILLVEIARETLSRVCPGGRVEVVAKVPGGPNGAALGPNGMVYICNNGGFEWRRENGTHLPQLQANNYAGGSINVVDPVTGRVDVLYDHCDGNRLCGPNDLVFDQFDGFWFTDHGKRRARELDRSFIYWARSDGSEIVQAIGPVITANGIGLSPDGSTLYVAETDTGRLWSWEIIGPGQVRKLPWPSLAGGRMVASLNEFVRFDSLAVTENGSVCVAALERGAVVEIAPDGRSRFHAVPDMYVTNICFGGLERRTAFVTMSYEGRLGAMQWHESGLKLRYNA